MAQEKEGIEQVEFEELEKIVRQKDSDSIVIDVREEEEYEAGHIPGVPLLPMNEAVEKVDDFDRDRSYIFVCRSGRRSQKVAQFFKANGFEHVANYRGGMLAWKGDLKQGLEKRVQDISELY